MQYVISYATAFIYSLEFYFHTTKRRPVYAVQSVEPYIEKMSPRSLHLTAQCPVERVVSRSYIEMRRIIDYLYIT